MGSIPTELARRGPRWQCASPSSVHSAQVPEVSQIPPGLRVAYPEFSIYYKGVRQWVNLVAANSLR